MTGCYQQFGAALVQGQVRYKATPLIYAAPKANKLKARKLTCTKLKCSKHF